MCIMVIRSALDGRWHIGQNSPARCKAMGTGYRIGRHTRERPAMSQRSTIVRSMHPTTSPTPALACRCAISNARQAACAHRRLRSKAKRLMLPRVSVVGHFYRWRLAISDSIPAWRHKDVCGQRIAIVYSGNRTSQGEPLHNVRQAVILTPLLLHADLPAVNC